MASESKPTSREAMIALVLACVACAVAIFGACSPFGALHFPSEPKPNGGSVRFLDAASFVLPIVLGLGAALLGGHAFQSIERSQGKIGGDGQAFFSLMIGLLACIIGLCTTFAVLIWPRLAPS